MTTRGRTTRDVLQAQRDDMLLLWLSYPGADEVTQRRICFEIGRRKLRDAVKALQERLSSPDPRLRAAAADALGLIGDQAAGEALRHLLSDASQPAFVRNTAAYALARLAYAPAFQELVATLKDPVPSVRVCAVAGLCAIGGAEASRAIERYLYIEHDDAVKNAMKQALHALPSTDVAALPEQRPASQAPLRQEATPNERPPLGPAVGRSSWPVPFEGMPPPNRISVEPSGASVSFGAP